MLWLLTTTKVNIGAVFANLFGVIEVLLLLITTPTVTCFTKPPYFNFMCN